MTTVPYVPPLAPRPRLPRTPRPATPVLLTYSAPFTCTFYWLLVGFRTIGGEGILVGSSLFRHFDRYLERLMQRDFTLIIHGTNALLNPQCHVNPLRAQDVDHGVWTGLQIMGVGHAQPHMCST